MASLYIIHWMDLLASWTEPPVRELPPFLGKQKFIPGGFLVEIKQKSSMLIGFSIHFLIGNHFMDDRTIYVPFF